MTRKILLHICIAGYVKVLRSILATAKQLKANGGRILLAGLKGAVKEVFEISGFYSIFQIFDSEAEALKQMT